MEQNPYESPASAGPVVAPPVPTQPQRRFGLLDIIVSVVGSAAAGVLLLSDVVRGPGDPHGYQIAAGIGGLIGLGLIAVWKLIRFISSLRPSRAGR